MARLACKLLWNIAQTTELMRRIEELIPKLFLVQRLIMVVRCGVRQRGGGVIDHDGLVIKLRRQ